MKNIKRRTSMRRVASILIVGIILGATCVVSATAQKKDAAKKEVVKKEIAPPVQPSPSQGTLKEVLSHYVGKVTNLGTLKKVTGDYFVLDDDGNAIIHPLSTLHTIKLMKNEETGETKIEIRLVGRD
jgi:hypothetical protein